MASGHRPESSPVTLSAESNGDSEDGPITTRTVPDETSELSLRDSNAIKPKESDENASATQLASEEAEPQGAKSEHAEPEESKPEEASPDSAGPPDVAALETELRRSDPTLSNVPPANADQQVDASSSGGVLAIEDEHPSTLPPSPPSAQVLTREVDVDFVPPQLDPSGPALPSLERLSLLSEPLPSIAGVGPDEHLGDVRPVASEDVYRNTTDPPPSASSVSLDSVGALTNGSGANGPAAGKEGEAPESLNSEEFDSRPPTIPSAAAVAAEPGKVAPLSHVGSEALAGDVIAGRYRVDDVLGEGGMGIVYRCTDQNYSETVALKRVIVPESDYAEEYVMWFYKEARALAAVDHPGIVGARDFGRLRDGSPFLVMDLAPGVSLHDLAHAGLKWSAIWHVVDQILGALAHAHARGIIHGDLKPSNVLVEEVQGEPPLVHMLDFGLAWLKRETHDERLDGEKPPEFKPHAGAGTPGYMAPEQIQHEQHHVTGATDLYALGCILYRLIGRGPPFGGTAKELLRSHAFKEIPRLIPAIDVPEGVVGVVMKMLAKQPWDRWEFAAEARREWAEFRPIDTPGEDFVLPRIRPGEPRPLPKGKGFAGRNPNLDADTERTTGLLSIRQSPLVGRQEVRQQLREICDEVIDGEGPKHRFVILVGPAGSGKSRIAEWLCQSVHEEGTMIPLWARYRAVRGPLDGVVGAITRYYNFERADRNTIEHSLLRRWNVTERDKTGRTWVAGAAEWFRPRNPGEEGVVGPSGVRFTLDTLATRRTVSRHVVRRVGEGKKLLFWLDDLHNASESTFEGFRRMHVEDADQPYVIVASVRAEEVHLGTPAAERLRQLREMMDGVAIDITPLEPDTTRQLIRRSLNLEDDAVEEAARRSRGNPLFALQQLHAWALEGSMQLRGQHYHVPPEVLAVRPRTTAELWQSRLLAVPETYRTAALAVAAISSDLRREVLLDLLVELGMPGEECIRYLQKAEILIPRGPGRYSWPHALLQEFLSTKLAKFADRKRVYQAAATALERHPLAATRRVVRQRVMNLILAGTPDAAAHLLFDFLQSSWNGAREPLSTLSDLDLLRGRLTGKTKAHQDRWRAEALRHVGRASEAKEYIERSAAAFSKLRDRANSAHCQRVLSHVCADLGNPNEAKRYAEEALATFEELGDDLGRAQTEAVLAEIGYLLGDFESARVYVDAGERHFEDLKQPLGRGQCLLLSSWIEHSEGAVERSRRLALDARKEFERVGYRLGTAQANASLAHVEHRMFNFHAAMVGAQEALVAFEHLRTPRGQAACRRLLSMIGVDIDEIDLAERNAEWCARISADLDDPWGRVEAKLLQAQVALMRRNMELADTLLEECQAFQVEEPEPHQHLLLVQAWLYRETGHERDAGRLIEKATKVFPEIRRVGDHTVHLLSRLSRFSWSKETRVRLESWRSTLSRTSQA